MAQQGYLRHPSIQGDTIVFVCDDDLWTVPASGGIARRLTAGLSEPSTPCLSPDGKWIAFVGRDEQHPEVYLMEAGGGPARRMTWLGPDVQVRGWIPGFIRSLFVDKGLKQATQWVKVQSEKKAAAAAKAAAAPAPAAAAVTP